MLVSEILRKKSGSAITMVPHDSVETAIRIFKEMKIGAILVCGPTGELVGIVTERDVLHGMATHAEVVLRIRMHFNFESHLVFFDGKNDDLLLEAWNKNAKVFQAIEGKENGRKCCFDFKGTKPVEAVGT